MAREVLCKLAAQDPIQGPEVRYPYFRCTECGQIANFEVACLLVTEDDGNPVEAIGACCVKDYLRQLGVVGVEQ